MREIKFKLRRRKQGRTAVGADVTERDDVMAERRMFAKTIIDSDAFLDMPLSAQALYFHLSMRADDDGFVNNPKKIQRMIGASDDDCKLLILKQFIITFENGVIVIKHWRVHNYIRRDTYKETPYIKEKDSLTVEKTGAYSLRPRYDLVDEVETPLLQSRNEPVDEPLTQDRIGKDRIGKDRLDTTPQAEAEKLPSCPFLEIKELYHSICVSYPKIRSIDGKRKISVAARWRTYKSLEVFKELFTLAETSLFLKGENNRNWSADFDWMMCPTNFSKILEHKYDNHTGGSENGTDRRNNGDDYAGTIWGS